MTRPFKKQHYVAALIALFIITPVTLADAGTYAGTYARADANTVVAEDAVEQDPYKMIFMPDKTSCYQVKYKSSIPLTSSFNGTAIIGNGVPTLIGGKGNEELTPAMVKAGGQLNVTPGIYKTGTELTIAAMPASGLNRVNLIYNASTTKILKDSGRIEQNQDQGLIYVMLRQYTELGQSGINVIIKKAACPSP